MTRLAITLNTPEARETAAEWARTVKDGTRVEFKAPLRTTDQNAAMWAMLGKISKELPWKGQTYDADDWKDYFLHALRRARWMPDEEGGFVPIGMRSSDMTREEMADLNALIREFGARHGVDLRPPREIEEEAANGR